MDAVSVPAVDSGMAALMPVEFASNPAPRVEPANKKLRRDDFMELL